MKDSSAIGQALVATVEHLIEGRRVVVFGDSTTDVPDTLIERGARLVHVYDDDLTRVAEASARDDSKEISYAPLGQSNAQRDGAFDFGIVLDLSAFDDGKKLVTRLRRALAPRGIALLLSPNPERLGRGPSYYDLYEWVSGEFDEVRMLGQLPFSGCAIVDFGAEGDPDFSLDTSFVQGNAQEPEWYLALASHFPVAVDGYTLVQLPTSEDTTSEDASPDPGQSETLEALRRSEAQLQAEVERLRKAERASQKGARDDERSARLQAALSERDALLRDLETRLTEAQRRIEQAEEEATEAQTALDAARQQAQAATKQAETARRQREADAARQQREVEAARKQHEADTARQQREVEAERKQHEADAARQQREVEAARKQHEADAARAQSQSIDPSELQQAQADVAALEAKLEERGRECQRLNEELRVSDKLAQELLSELDALKARAQGDGRDGSVVELEQQLEQARAAETRRVADLTTAQWTIQRLESQLGKGPGAHER